VGVKKCLRRRFTVAQSRLCYQQAPRQWGGHHKITENVALAEGRRVSEDQHCASDVFLHRGCKLPEGYLPKLVSVISGLACHGSKPR
jgi:hypothetical protein